MGVSGLHFLCQTIVEYDMSLMPVYALRDKIVSSAVLIN